MVSAKSMPNVRFTRRFPRCDHSATVRWSIGDRLRSEMDIIVRSRTSLRPLSRRPQNRDWKLLVRGPALPHHAEQDKQKQHNQRRCHHRDRVCSQAIEKNLYPRSRRPATCRWIGVRAVTRRTRWPRPKPILTVLITLTDRRHRATPMTRAGVQRIT